MKFSLIISTTILALSSSTSAANCQNGLNYCGWNLLKRGDYKSTIVATLQEYGIPPTTNNIYNFLYHCKDSVGGISVLAICNGDGSCQDGGAGHSDYC